MKFELIFTYSLLKMSLTSLIFSVKLGESFLVFVYLFTLLWRNYRHSRSQFRRCSLCIVLAFRIWNNRCWNLQVFDLLKLFTFREPWMSKNIEYTHIVSQSFGRVFPEQIGYEVLEFFRGMLCILGPPNRLILNILPHLLFVLIEEWRHSGQHLIN